ncbi:MAG: branched-chain amino acid transport system permease protein [Actinomycetota bacterium]|jgi:branched-subunit amino acid ABC-type transport system permease component|nr:branched-chain amino acid transport system permease protein [Actinomycetota bacterium]
MTWIIDNLITVVDGLAFGVLLFVIALGLSLVFGVMDVLNLAHGALYMVGAYVAASLVVGGSISMAAFLGAALLAALIGGFAGWGLAAMIRPVAKRGHLDQALLTLGIALVVGDLISMGFGNDVRSVPAPDPLVGSTSVFGQSYPVYRLVVIVVGLVLAVGALLLIEHTRIGSLVRAAVVDPQMVRALGTDTGKLVAGVFASGAALAAFGGVMGAPILSAYPGLDSRVLLLGLVVVVIGGLGSVSGALVGALIIGQVEVLGVSLLPSHASFLVFGTMALVLLLRPQGLLAKSRTAG